LLARLAHHKGDDGRGQQVKENRKANECKGEEEREGREKREQERQERKEVRQEQEERRNGHTTNREPKRAAPSQPISVKGNQVPVSCFVLYIYHT
jgi:hypothetical protein